MLNKLMHYQNNPVTKNAGYVFRILLNVRMNATVRYINLKRNYDMCPYVLVFYSKSLYGSRCLSCCQ